MARRFYYEPHTLRKVVDLLGKDGMTTETRHPTYFIRAKARLSLVPLDIRINECNQDDLGVEDQFRHVGDPIKIDIRCRMKDIESIKRTAPRFFIWR